MLELCKKCRSNAAGLLPFLKSLPIEERLPSFKHLEFIVFQAPIRLIDLLSLYQSLDSKTKVSCLKASYHLIEAADKKICRRERQGPYGKMHLIHDYNTVLEALTNLSEDARQFIGNSQELVFDYFFYSVNEKGNVNKNGLLHKDRPLTYLNTIFSSGRDFDFNSHSARHLIALSSEELIPDMYLGECTQGFNQIAIKSAVVHLSGAIRVLKRNFHTEKNKIECIRELFHFWNSDEFTVDIVALVKILFDKHGTVSEFMTFVNLFGKNAAIFEAFSTLSPYLKAIIKNKEAPKIYLELLRLCENCPSGILKNIVSMTQSIVSTLQLGNSQAFKNLYTTIFQIIQDEMQEKHANEFSWNDLKENLEEKMLYLKNETALVNRLLILLAIHRMHREDNSSIAQVFQCGSGAFLINEMIKQRQNPYEHLQKSLKSATTIATHLRSFSPNEREDFWAKTARFRLETGSNDPRILNYHLDILEKLSIFPQKKRNEIMEILLLLFEENPLELLTNRTENHCLPTMKAINARKVNTSTYIGIRLEFYVYCSKLIPILSQLREDELCMSVQLAAEINKKIANKDNYDWNSSLLALLSGLIGKIFIEGRQIISPNAENVLEALQVNFLNTEAKIRLLLDSCSPKNFGQWIACLSLLHENLKSTNESEALMIQGHLSPLEYVLKTKGLLDMNRILPTGHTLKITLEQDLKNLEGEVAFLD